MHGFEQVANVLTQAGSGILCAVGILAGLNFWKSDTKLDNFGRCHATPLARTWDATAWTLKQLFSARRLGRGANSVFHLVITAFFPIGAVLFTNGTAVDAHPVAFGIAGLIAGVISEAPEAFARNAQYKTAARRDDLKAEHASQLEKPKGLARIRALGPEQKVGAVALPVALAELLIGGGLYYLNYLTTILGATLSAIVLGVAFVAWAEVMSVISTLWLVTRNGSPFKSSA